MHTTPHSSAASAGACGPDLVPGTPPLPISVWRTPSADTDLNPLLPNTLTRQVAGAFTRPGQHLVDLTGGLMATVAPGRTVHAGSFGEGDITIPTGSPKAGSVALIAVAWPPTNTTQGQRGEASATLLAAAGNWLRPGGVLALLVGNPPGRPPADYGPFIASAAAAGLGYLQHIAAVRTPVIGDTITALQPAGVDVLDDVAVHLGVHADVFVFAARGGARRG